MTCPLLRNAAMPLPNVHLLTLRIPSMRRPICLALVAAAVSISPGAAQPKAERNVYLYNWTDSSAPTVMEEFTKETGTKARYDPLDSNDTLDPKLLPGRSGYD